MYFKIKHLYTSINQPSKVGHEASPVKTFCGKMLTKNGLLRILMLFGVAAMDAELKAQALYVGSGENFYISSNTQLYIASGETQIASGGTLTVNGTYSTKGNFTNAGSISSSAGVIEFLGTSQSVSAGGASLKTVNIGSTASVTLTSAMIIPGGTGSGTLTVSSGGTLNANGYLTLKSDANGTGRIGEGSASGNYLTGNVVVERYIPARRAFRILSPSVTTTSSIYANWQESGSSNSGLGTHITGSSSGSYGFDATSSGNPSLFTHSNSTLTWTAVANTNATTLTAGSPLRILVRGDRTVDLTKSAPTPTVTVLRATGTVGQGDITVSNLNQTADAFSIVGNPYPSGVNMASVLAAATNVNSNYYYVWDPNMNTRGAYVTVSLSTGSNSVGSAANEYLQAGQACFVKTVSAGSASLTFKESYKGSSNTNTFKTLPPLSSLNLRLYQTDSMAKGKMPVDAVLLAMDPGYNMSIDQADALKAANQDENFALETDGKLFSVQCLNIPADSQVVDINIQRYRDTKYTFKADFTGDLGMDVFLFDQFKKQYHTIKANDITLIPMDVVTNDTNSTAKNRFQLVFRTTNRNGVENIAKVATIVSPNPIRSVDWMVQGLRVSMAGKLLLESCNYKVVNQLGRVVSAGAIQADSHIRIQEHLAAGLYFVQIQGVYLTTIPVLVVE